MLLISRVSSFLDQKKNRNINQKREAKWNVVDLERTNSRRGKREKIKLIGIESIVTFIRCHVSSELFLSPPRARVTQLPLLRYLRTFDCFSHWRNSETLPLPELTLGGALCFLRWGKKENFFFDSRRLFPLRSTLGCGLTRLVAMSLSQSRGDFKVPVYFQLDKKNVKSRSRPANNLWAIDRALHRGAAKAAQQHVCIETLSVKSFFFLTSYFSINSLTLALSCLVWCPLCNWLCVHSAIVSFILAKSRELLHNTTSQVDITCDSSVTHAFLLFLFSEERKKLQLHSCCALSR